MDIKIDSNEAIIKILIILANADGNYHGNEQAFIKDIVKNRGVSNKIYNEILNETNDSNKSYKDLCMETVDLIKDPILRKEALSELTNLAAADFILHEDEMFLLQIIAEKWNMFQESSHA